MESCRQARLSGGLAVALCSADGGCEDGDVGVEHVAPQRSGSANGHGALARPFAPPRGS
jgi:hypothetical protein